MSAKIVNLAFSNNTIIITCDDNTMWMRYVNPEGQWIPIETPSNITMRLPLDSEE